MRLSLKAITIALATSAGALLAVPTGVALYVQPAMAADDIGAREAAARALINEALPASRAPEIYEDLRVSARNVWLPVLDEMATGKLPLGIPADPMLLDVMKKVVVVMTYATRASDEIDPVAKANRDAIIADCAQVLAKYATLEEINNVQGALKLSATRKTFDVSYALSRTVTGFTLEETRSAQEFSGWMSALAIQFSTGQIAADPAPSQARVLKAQAIVNDLPTITHMDEMVADGIRFARDVVLKTLPADQQAEVAEKISAFEFAYSTQKPVLLAAAPAQLAMFLKEEDLSKLHAFLKSPVFSKAFKLIFDVEKSATQYTVQDITAARAYFEELEKAGKIRQRSDEEKAAAEKDWQALGQKWSEKLLAAITPATRDGLMKSIADLQALDLPTPPNPL